MRLTMAEIKKQYPNRWVGLSNIEYVDASKKIIKSAEVVYTDKTASELGLMALQGQNVQPLYTTPDEVFQLGVVGGLK